MDWDGVMAALRARAGIPMGWTPQYLPLAGESIGPSPSPSPQPSPSPSPDPLRPEAAPTIAVDGSHAVLADNGTTWVVAVRAAALAWPGPAPPVAPEVVVVAPEQAQRRLARPVHSAEAFAAALREQAEGRALLGAVRAAPPGALVLADGGLRGLPAEAQEAADAARAVARERAVHLVGVAKRSSIERDGVPLASALYANGPPGPWAVAVGDGVYVARLHRAARQAFRVDAPDLATIARLLPLCRDAAYPGYPYPLAKAHNQVAFTAGAVAELRLGLERAARRGGARAAALVQDFHATLDRNVA